MSGLTLEQLGWRNAFQQQLDSDADQQYGTARVIGVERSGWLVLGPAGERVVEPTVADDRTVTVGDWLLLEPDSGRAIRRLDRFSVFKRRAPGTERREQLIAANVDTLFVVSY